LIVLASDFDEETKKECEKSAYDVKLSHPGRSEDFIKRKIENRVGVTQQLRDYTRNKILKRWQAMELSKGPIGQLALDEFIQLQVFIEYEKVKSWTQFRCLQYNTLFGCAGNQPTA
jgi:hypothetical protein